MTRRLHAVVLGGGSGTRFWPLSRRQKPKQHVRLIGEDTLLKQTFDRVRPVAPEDAWWLVAGPHIVSQPEARVPGLQEEHVVVEPEARNTFPAIVLAAIKVEAKNPKAVMAVLPADHHVADAPALNRALEIAANHAEQDAIVTLGITPQGPETAYGYIERAHWIDEADKVGQVRQFREKPNRETAQEFLAAGGFVWNAGIFVMKPQVFLAEAMRQHPATEKTIAALRTCTSDPETMAPHFRELEATSVDYAVMEGAGNLRMVEVECGWSDVGSWSALDDVVTRDDAGNAAQGETILLDASNNVVFAEGDGLVAVLGVHDLIVVQAHGATLVAPKDRAQDVRKVVAALKERNLDTFL